MSRKKFKKSFRVAAGDRRVGSRFGGIAQGRAGAEQVLRSPLEDELFGCQGGHGNRWLER